MGCLLHLSLMSVVGGVCKHVVTYNDTRNDTPPNTPTTKKKKVGGWWVCCWGCVVVCHMSMSFFRCWGLGVSITRHLRYLRYLHRCLGVGVSVASLSSFTSLWVVCFIYVVTYVIWGLQTYIKEPLKEPPNNPQRKRKFFKVSFGGLLGVS